MAATKKDRSPTSKPASKSTAEKKDRGEDKTAVASKTSEKDEVCLQQFLNNGNEVTLTDGRTVKVRDLPFESWLDGLSTIIPVLAGMSDTGMDEKQLLMYMSKDKNIRNQIFEMMHCGNDLLSSDEIRQLGAKDTLRLLVGFKNVIDFDGVKELFTRLVSPN